jgi:hypothetical protein
MSTVRLQRTFTEGSSFAWMSLMVHICTQTIDCQSVLFPYITTASRIGSQLSFKAKSCHRIELPVLTV